MVFNPNPKAVKEEADKLLAKDRGGGYPTIDDACLVAFNKKWQHEQGSNGFLFWEAVYQHLNLNRH